MDENKNNQPEEFQDQDFRDTFGDGAEFQKAFDKEPEVPAEPAAPAEVPKPVKKGRPARKNPPVPEPPDPQQYQRNLKSKEICWNR